MRAGSTPAAVAPHGHARHGHAWLSLSALGSAAPRAPHHVAVHAPMRGGMARAAPTDDLGLEDGWGVEPSQPPTKQAAMGKKARRKQGKNGTEAAAAPATGNKKASRRTRSPYMDMSSSEGMLGLTLLQQKLLRAEAGKVGMSPAEQQELLDSLPAAGKPRRKQAKLPTAAVPPAPPRRQKIVYEDDDGNTWEEAEDVDVTDAAPSFELNLVDQEMEFVEYDAEGNAVRRVDAGPAPGADVELGDGEELDDEDDLLDDGDDEFDFAEGDEWGQLSKAAAASAVERRLEAEASGSGAAAARLVEDALGDTGAGSGMLMDLDGEPDDWGLDEVGGDVGPDGRPRRRTLGQELGVTRGEGSRPLGVDEDLGVTVTWGGSAGTSATDLEEQERLLSRMFKPHKVRKLMDHQRAALSEAEKLQRGSGTKRGTDARLHRKLRIVQGSAANKRILSSAGAQTRPMMEKVRQAIFNMIQAQAGTVGCLPDDARWLDLFAGTGSVGLEALSRGVRECHFVEMDPWVTRNVLGKNISTCGFQRASIVHTNKAEQFLQRAVQAPSFAGGAFDFVSMCPPYLLVSYPELFDLLERGSLLHEGSILFVEYPSQLKHQVPDKVGSLVQLRNRIYGRTWIVVYGPAQAGLDDDDGVDY